MESIKLRPRNDKADYKIAHLKVDLRYKRINIGCWETAHLPLP